jgi:putative PIN family toxin of toxin-antitoxin system
MVVSAALNPNGTSRRALAAARAQGTIALSQAVFDEIAEVLSRPKFARILTQDRRREALELLAAAALWVDPTEKVTDCRDAKDNRYLELALAARATAIVSGDEDLLVLNPWRGVRVLRPARFLEELWPDGRQDHR